MMHIVLVCHKGCLSIYMPINKVSHKPFYIHFDVFWNKNIAVYIDVSLYLLYLYLVLMKKIKQLLQLVSSKPRMSRLLNRPYVQSSMIRLGIRESKNKLKILTSIMDLKPIQCLIPKINLNVMNINQQSLSNNKQQCVIDNWNGKW